MIAYYKATECQQRLMPSLTTQLLVSQIFSDGLAEAVAKDKTGLQSRKATSTQNTSECVTIDAKSRRASTETTNSKVIGSVALSRFARCIDPQSKNAADANSMRYSSLTRRSPLASNAQRMPPQLIVGGFVAILKSCTTALLRVANQICCNNAKVKFDHFV